MAFNPQEHPHNRYNPLQGEWVLVSPHRALRPWAGQTEASPPDDIPPYDPNNPLCPSNVRSSGVKNPDYTGTYVFTNDFPALLEEGPAPPDAEDDPLFKVAPAYGTCRVVCFHPRSDKHIGTMDRVEVVEVVKEWMRQLEELGRKYLWVQIFENRGAINGCSNPHPHCQIWASSFLPNIPRLKELHQKEYYAKHGRALLEDYLKKELEKNERIVWQNRDFVILVPYWACWPFETMILPKRQIQRMLDLNCSEVDSLAEALQVLVAKYDNVFKCAFPYSGGWQGAPTGEQMTTSMPHWTFHGWFLPPLLRSATVKKFMVGYELLAQVQRDLTPEKAAKVLRELPSEHYKLKGICRK